MIARVRTLFLLIALLAGLPAIAAAQEPGVDPSAPVESGDTADDPWGFGEEEEAEPTLAEQFATQWVDVVLFAGFAVLTMAGFLRKDDRIHIATLIVAFAYLGLYKSEIVSIVNVFSMAGMICGVMNATCCTAPALA